MRLLKEDLWEKLREKRVIIPPPKDRTQLGTNVRPVKLPYISDIGIVSHRID